MKTKLITLLLAILLSGCTLASSEYQPETDPNLPIQQEDVLVGIYLSYSQDFSDEIPKFDLSDDSQTFFICDEKIENNSSYSWSQLSGKFIGGHSHIKLTDEGVLTTFTGKVPVLRNSKAIISAFLVRKDSKGNYYTEVSGSYQGVSQIFFEESRTVELDGEISEAAMNLEITFEVYDPLSSVRVIVMNKNYDVRSSQLITEETMIEVNEQDELILIEETRINHVGDEYQTIDIYSYQKIKSDREIRHLIIGDGDQPFAEIYPIILKPAN